MGRHSKSGLWSRAATVIALAAATLVAPVGPASSLACAHLTQSVKTFHVVMKPSKKVYRVGEKIAMRVTVTRPADEDPLGEGVPIDSPYRHPAGDISVTVGVFGPTGFPGSDWGVTNEDGKVTLTTKAVTKYRKKLFVDIRAEKKYFQTQVGCIDPVEYGTVSYTNPFDVR